MVVSWTVVVATVESQGQRCTTGVLMGKNMSGASLFTVRVAELTQN